MNIRRAPTTSGPSSLTGDPLGRWRGRRRTALRRVGPIAMLAMFVAQALIQVTPVAASAVPSAPAPSTVGSAPLGATPWTGTGATNPAVNSALANDPSSFTIAHDGTTGLAELDYNFSPPNPGASPSGRWTFTSTAATTGSLSLHWLYSGFHGWCGASIGLHVVVIRSGSTVSDHSLADATDPCNYSFPSGGFNVAGNVSIAVQGGDTFGFVITGTNYNLSPLSGSLTVSPHALYVAPAPAASGGGTCAAPDYNSIQAAVDAAPDGSAIHVCAATYLLTAPITVTKDLAFEGDGAATTILDGANGVSPVQIIHAPGHTITVLDLTFRNGHATFPDTGGAIEAQSVVVHSSTFTGNSADVTGGALSAGWSQGGTVTVTDSTFDSNSGGNIGGAIRAGGSITASGSTFGHNTAGWGGALAGGALITVATSTFDSNHATNSGGFGGAISGPTTVSGSTFHANTAPIGGAIGSASNQAVTIDNSTFAANVATTRGGAVDGGGVTTITNATFLNNTAPVGAAIHTSNTYSVGSTAKNTIFAAAPGVSNCSGPLVDGGGNLSTNGCTDGTTSLASLDLGSLDLNGGPTATIALHPASVAIDAGVAAGCPATDQRGTARPQLAACDSGAYEATSAGVPETPQTPFAFVVTTSADHDDGVCGVLDCTLREAINAHNLSNDGTQHPITFAIPGAGRHTITLGSALPAISSPVDLNGESQPGSSCASPETGLPGLNIVLVGPGGGATVNGITLTYEASHTGSWVHGLAITGFTGTGLDITGNNAFDGLQVWCNQLDSNDGDGIRLTNVNGGLIGSRPDGNDLPNAITNNLGNGVTLRGAAVEISQTNGVRFDANVIRGNGRQGIDLGDNGRTPNDPLEASPPTGVSSRFANGYPNTPVLFRAESGAGAEAGISGQIQTAAGVRQDVTLYIADTCDATAPQGGSIIGSLVAAPASGFGGVGPTDSNGVANFTLTIGNLPAGKYVTATATGLLRNGDPNGATSEFSDCVRIGSGNDSWPKALDITNAGGPVSDVISYAGQSRWYKVAITPSAQVTATVANQPTSDTLLGFTDIQAAYDGLEAASLTQQTAESSGGSTTGKFSGGTGTKFSGGTGTKFSGGTGAKFSGGTGAKFSGDLGFSADAFSGGTGTKFSGGTGTKFSPVETAGGTGTKFSPDAYAGAQVSSLVAFNDTAGLAPKSIVANTWTNTGFYYFRVSAQDGAFNPRDAFQLSVSQAGNNCGGLVPFSSALLPSPTATNVRTVILTDSSRIVGSAEEQTALADQLAAFAARPEVGGVVVDLSTIAHINALNAQADAHPACPYAKNLVAIAAKGVVDSYRASSPNLAYVVLVGGDNAIPFFRYPDTAELAPETAFYPPVDPVSVSEASLRLNYVLGQDAYGAGAKVSLGASTFPVPDLAVGRLVETASEASGMLDAYLNHTNAGVVGTPVSSLSTGYDFMADAATSVASDFAAGIGTGAGKVNDTLISETWTATDLTSKLLGPQRHDLVFLAGHFSANRALAADQNTTISTLDLVASQTDFQNSIVFSQGCHSGYGIVDAQGINGVTQPLDWAQAFARKRATLVAGTGYQYGDTELIQYSELIYASFAKELRTGSGPVSVGQALINAKKDYLRLTPDLGGTDTKALLQSTLYGLPMLSVNLSGARITPPADTSVVPSVSTVPDGPGAPVASGGLGLQTAPLTLTPGTLPSNSGAGGATYLTGPDGVAAQPYQPALPRILKNVTVPGLVLRGVGFRGGAYSDTGNVTPLVSVPATEQGSGQTTFSSPTFYPAGIASVSYFDALGSGATRLLVTPVQHRANNAGSATRRAFSNLNLQLFYSSFNATRTIDGQTFRPSIAAAPSIVGVTATVNGSNIDFDAHVSGDPSAGIQQVWVTYTGFDNTWKPLDLVVDPLDATHFTGSLPIPGGPANANSILFMVQAVNGTGLVSADLNGGAYYSITPEAVQAPNPTTVTFDPASGSINPSGGTYGSTVTFAATLGGADTNVGQPIIFALGGDTLTASTDGNGHASVSWPLIQAPSGYQVTASFAGDAANTGSFASATFSLGKADTSIALSLGTQTPADSGIVATLKDDHNVPMDQRSVYFVITGAAGSLTRTAFTDASGRASVGQFPLPAGPYAVKAYFLGAVPGVSTQAQPLTDEAYNPSSSGTAVPYTATAPVRLTVAFTAANKDFDGNTAAVITGCSLIGVIGTADVQCSAGGASASFADNFPGTFKTVTGADRNNYTFNSTAYTTADINAVDPGNVLGAVAAADATFKELTDGFDVLFSKGATTSVMTLRNTEPGTFHYLLALQNETGIALNSGNGASGTTIITIPGVPATGVNLTIPTSAASMSNPAFTMQGDRPVRVHPDEDHDTELPIQVSYAYLGDTPGSLGDCLAAGVTWRAGQPADGSPVKCVKVTGFGLAKKHKAKIDLNLEFRLKNTTGWLTSQNPSLNFRAGFPFKSVTSVSLDSRWGSMAGTYPGNQITGIVGVGQAVTAIGGFVFDTNGGGIADAVVRVYNSPPSAANACTTTGQVAAYTTMPDGFYFVSQKGVNDASTQATGPNPLPSGIQYYVAVCGVPGVGQAFWPARSVDHKLGNKEFDGEDFYVSAPSTMAVTTQPTSGRRGSTLSSLKITVKDAFGYTVTADNSTTVTIAVPAGSGLSGTLSRKVVSGVATFSDLKFSTAGTWTLAVTGTPTNWGSGTSSAPIVISP